MINVNISCMKFSFLTMKREAKFLLNKAINSLLLCVEHFNSASDTGRVEVVLILLDHSFEMLLKASLVERGAKIRQKGDANTIGFDRCIRKALRGGHKVQFLTEDQALTLQIINGHRDAAQHYLLDLKEELLYSEVQAGFTLFQTILKDVFDEQLGNYFPNRVLPVSTTPPLDIAEIFHSEAEAIKLLLQPGKRKRTEALACLRSLAIMEDALHGQNQTPSDEDLLKIAEALKEGNDWVKVFPGVASINVTTTGYGPSLEIKITKKEGVPVHIVPEGTPHAGVVALKRVNELDFYNLSFTQLNERFNLTSSKLQAVIWYLKIQDDDDCFKSFRFGSTLQKRYSQRAISKIKTALPELNLDKVWQSYRKRNKHKKTNSIEIK